MKIQQGARIPTRRLKTLRSQVLNQSAAMAPNTLRRRSLESDIGDTNRTSIESPEKKRGTKDMQDAQAQINSQHDSHKTKRGVSRARMARGDRR